MSDSRPDLALVFDFGGVLVDWNPRHLYRKIFGGDEAAMENFLAEIHFYEWNQHQDAGRPFSEAVAELCQEHPQHCDLIRLYDDRYEESISGPIWPTVNILEALKKAGYPLYGLSNWPEEKYKLVRPKYPFFDLFDDIVISGKVKIAKPDLGIFTILLARAQRAAWQCVYIDDSIRNIEVAQEIGFKCIHFQSPEKLVDDLAAFEILIYKIDPESN
jgi:2-haloacid dehalogenase